VVSWHGATRHVWTKKMMFFTYEEVDGEKPYMDKLSIFKVLGVGKAILKMTSRKLSNSTMYFTKVHQLRCSLCLTYTWLHKKKFQWIQPILHASYSTYLVSFQMFQGLMIRMDYKLFWPQVMLPCLKCSYQCI